MRYTDLLAFTVGVVIMGTELTATRFVAPYFGTSTFVWTNVIAVIMIALSLGYLAGGKLAARGAKLEALQWRLLLGAAFLGAIPYLAAPLTNLFILDIYQAAPGSTAVLVGSFILVAVLFFIPTFLLAMTSPFLIGYITKTEKDAGPSAGRIFAISTVGSILGTFLPTVFMVPVLGSKRTMLVFAGALAMMTVPYLIRSRAFTAVVLLPSVLLPATISPDLRVSPHLVSTVESPYQYIQVYEQDGVRRLVYNEGGGFQSVYRMGETTTGTTYFETMALAPTLIADDPIDILILGLAGGTISREIDLLYPDREIHMTGVEIDPAVIEQAKTYFDLERDRLTIVNMDARAFLATTDETYDIILIDAYSNQMYIPSHLVTNEFFEEVSEHVADGGMIAFNVNARTEESELLRIFTNTVANVFPHVQRSSIPGHWNYVVFAFASREDREAFSVPAELQETAEMMFPTFSEQRFDPEEKIFTDDWAPTEWMTDEMIWEEMTQ